METSTCIKEDGHYIKIVTDHFGTSRKSTNTHDKKLIKH